METTLSLRPRLTSFRVQAFRSDNRIEGNGNPWKFELKQEIQVGLAAPPEKSLPFQAIITIILTGDANDESTPDLKATFQGEYIARFNFPVDTGEITESIAADWLASDSNQYLVVAQAFPLAMMHFRRELLATGFDGRKLPMGI